MIQQLTILIAVETESLKCKWHPRYFSTSAAGVCLNKFNFLLHKEKFSIQ